MALPIAPKPLLRRFHQARWDEPVIFELSVPGERGVLVSEIEDGISKSISTELPSVIARKVAPALPQIGQMKVLKHYLRLSQENLGADLNVDIGQGTCTMKYSPKVNDLIIRRAELFDLHPLQDPDKSQGALEIIWRTEKILAEVSGLDAVSLQTSSGSGAIWANVAIIRAYFQSIGEGDIRDEIVTTIFSHPSNAAVAKAAGYKVITLHPDENGYPNIDEYKKVISHRTAALMITNPEDTGIFNPHIKEIIDLFHSVGALASYDQANANGILGITRAKEAGFDLCHFNLHKTFSTPHACGGPGAGASCVTAKLAKFLPSPVVVKQGEKFILDDNRPSSIGKVAPFYGVLPNIVRAYSWIMNLGAKGLREVAEVAVLNNNYLLKNMIDIKGASAPYAPNRPRVEQVRYSWNELFEKTGITTEEIGLRALDFGLHYWTSHHPFIVPQPLTLEPTESYSREELDEYLNVMRHIAKEALENPEIIRTAPHNQTVHQTAHKDFDDPKRWAITWRAYLRKYPEVSKRKKAKS